MLTGPELRLIYYRVHPIAICKALLSVWHSNCSRVVKEDRHWSQALGQLSHKGRP